MGNITGFCPLNLNTLHMIITHFFLLLLIFSPTLDDLGHTPLCEWDFNPSPMLLAGVDGIPLNSIGRFQVLLIHWYFLHVNDAMLIVYANETILETDWERHKSLRAVCLYAKLLVSIIDWVQVAATILSTATLIFSITYWSRACSLLAFFLWFHFQNYMAFRQDP